MVLLVCGFCYIMRLVINMENSFPKRKHPRLKNYDYSTVGAYYITICTHNRRCLLSHIVGHGLSSAETQYTAYGRIAEEQLLLLEKRYPSLKMDQYVIMPNHIHIIIFIKILINLFLIAYCYRTWWILIFCNFFFFKIYQ